MNKFTERLREAMSAANMTQSALAEKSGCSKAAISQYLSGKNQPTPAKMAVLADALEVQTDFLMGVNIPTSQAMPHKITPEIAAKCIGRGKDYVKYGLRNGTLDIGSAVQFPSGKWQYDIQPSKLKAHVGPERFNEFFGLTV